MADRNEDLLPCRFCGGEASISYYDTESLWGHETVTYTKVGCDNCDIYFNTEPGFEVEAPAKWNSRPGPQSATDAEAMTVINPDEWEPCRPSYLMRGGSCNAPRVWNAKSMNHWHPKLSPATDAEAMPVDRKAVLALDKAVDFRAYHHADPLGIRFGFANDEARLAATNALDEAFAALAQQETNDGE